jgi:hypothetical protein
VTEVAIGLYCSAVLVSSVLWDKVMLASAVRYDNRFMAGGTRFHCNSDTNSYTLYEESVKIA